MTLTNQRSKSLLMVLPELMEMIKTGTSPPASTFQTTETAIFSLKKEGCCTFKKKSIYLFSKYLI